MGTIKDLIFRIPLERSQFSTLFLNVAQSIIGCLGSKTVALIVQKQVFLGIRLVPHFRPIVA
jgi:hypothetical protein